MSTYSERQALRRAEYRKQAEFYERWFNRASSPQRKASFRSMADFWWRRANRQ